MLGKKTVALIVVNAIFGLLAIMSVFSGDLSDDAKIFSLGASKILKSCEYLALFGSVIINGLIVIGEHLEVEKLKKKVGMLED